MILPVDTYTGSPLRLKWWLPPYFSKVLNTKFRVLYQVKRDPVNRVTSVIKGVERVLLQDRTQLNNVKIDIIFITKEYLLFVV